MIGHFNEKTIAELKAMLDEITLDEEIIETEKGVIPVVPMLVAEVTYLEITKAGMLRAPVFVRLRKDKESVECVFPD
ncbi:MAG: hypothetical protein HY392_04575 [Candidatus Diapherotrites archaeon]|nr:hypothetical protein [Candidatus Diapherotrites archaeon]